MPTHGLPARVTSRAAHAHVSIDDELARQCASYLDLLARWNHTINLTGLDVDPPNDEAIDRLIVEAIVAARFFDATDRRVIDVGSGGGSPALPLKLALPRLQMVLVESKSRKAAFLREAVRHLGLDGVEVENRRLEDVAVSPSRADADVVTIRAVRADEDLVARVAAMLGSGGRVFWFATRDADLSSFPAAERHVLVPGVNSLLVILKADYLVI